MISRCGIGCRQVVFQWTNGPKSNIQGYIPTTVQKLLYCGHLKKEEIQLTGLKFSGCHGVSAIPFETFFKVDCDARTRGH